MKNSNTCPKCGAHEILVVPGSSGPYGVGNNIQTGITVFSAALVNRHICTACGYSEEWLDKADIEKVIKKFSK